MNRCGDTLDLGRGFYCVCYKRKGHIEAHEGGATGPAMTWPVVIKEVGHA